MFIYRSLTIFFVAVFAVVFTNACTETPNDTQLRALKDTTKGVNLLALASSDGASLNSPWNAQEQDLLALAKQLPSNSDDIEFALGAITETAALAVVLSPSPTTIKVPPGFLRETVIPRLLPTVYGITRRPMAPEGFLWT